VTCPACWEKNTLEIDLSVPEQSYIEDCQVCCQPMRVTYTSKDGELTEIRAENPDG